MAQYQSNGLKLPEDFELSSLDERVNVLLGFTTMATKQEQEPATVAHVTAAYREHIKTKFKHSPQDKLRHERLCEILEQVVGKLPAVDFGPIKLAEVRDILTKKGLRKKAADTTKKGLPKKTADAKPSRTYITDW